MENVPKTNCLKRTWKRPWKKLLFTKKCSLRVDPSDFIKHGLHHRDFLQTGSARYLFFKISESFLWGAALIIFVREVATLLKLTSLECTFQPAFFTYSNLTIETLEQCVKYVQINNKDTRTKPMALSWCLYC